MTVTDNNYVAARPGTALGQPASLFKPVEMFVAAVPSGGGFIDVPGPTAGKVRVFDAIFLTNTVSGAAMTTVSLVAPTRHCRCRSKRDKR